MAKAVLSRIQSVLHWLDPYAEPIAPLNIRGKTKITTSVGGLAGIFVSGLLLWFLQTRLDKLTSRNDSNMSEVTQGLDLLAEDTPSFHSSEMSYSVGVGIYSQQDELLC
jgi:hypothetical protein